MNVKFFEERQEQSYVKARIVQKYFDAWSNIVVQTATRYRDGKIAYIDLYAGPGRYKDGAASTPLLVIESAINNPRVRDHFVAYLNDMDKNNSQTLAEEIAKIPNVNTLKHPPVIGNDEVGADAEKYFAETSIIPSFTFFDPFGYKGLSLKLVNGVIKDWGCDCVFFFNYNRINAGISNSTVKMHIDALFGEDRANKLRVRVDGAKPGLRLEMVLEELSLALREMGGKYILPFRFKNEHGKLTHHLVFVSKSFKGYRVMKDIMAKESSTAEQGVASFAYSPADETMPLLFGLSQPLEGLQKSLLDEFRGVTVPFEALFEAHSVDKPFVERNYKDALLALEAAEKIAVTDPDGKKRRSGTFANRLIITFPD